MKELTLENVSYQYPGALHLALDHIAGQFVPCLLYTSDAADD